MYDYSILALIATIAIFSKPSQMRVFVVFSGMCTLMLTIGATIISSGYGEHYHRHFVVCGLLHLIIQIILSKEKNMNGIIFHIYIINIAFIYLNLFGFLIDFAYILNLIVEQSRFWLITSYNVGCEVLYSLVLAAIMYNWCCDGIWSTGIHRITSFFRGGMRRFVPQLCLSKKEERT